MFLALHRPLQKAPAGKKRPFGVDAQYLYVVATIEAHAIFGRYMGFRAAPDREHRFFSQICYLSREKNEPQLHTIEIS